MILKISALFAVVLGYFTLIFAASAASSICSSKLFPFCSAFDGINPPHAVDTSGKAIPASSTVQPEKPIILAKDSQDGNWGELKRESAFDHSKHTTDIKYSIDGKTATTCNECHHTDQPSAPKGQEYLKKFNRKELLTTKQLETSKEPVQSCRACHFQESTEETSEFPPEGVTYPKKSGKPSYDKLTNNNAYHENCKSCHAAVKKRDSKSKAPTGCGECHSSL